MRTAIDEALVTRATTDLAAIRASGELQQRYEIKYVLTSDSAIRLVEALPAHWRVLEVERRRFTAYRSTYFDDRQFSLFQDHIKERRFRYKIRTRRYGDDPYEMLEIKLRTGRGATDKRRVERNGVLGSELTDAEHRWIADTVFRTYRLRGLPPLQRSLGLNYTRRTMFNPTTGERLTIDSGIVAQGTFESVAPVGDAVVVEVKSVDCYGSTVRQLHRHALRPLTFSKYCAAFAALHPEADQRARRRAQRSFAHS